MTASSWFRGAAAAAAAVVFAAAGGTTALADDISNNLDGTVDAIAESMTLAPGGATSTTTLRVVQVNGDGKQGCNLTGQTVLTTAVTSSNTTVATVAPASVTFTSCSDTKVLTVTSVGTGTATVSLSETQNSTDGTFNLQPATFAVTVTAPAKTATTTTVTCPPSVTYTGSARTPCTATVTGSDGFSEILTENYTANTDAGTATATAAYAGSSTREASSGTASFLITKASSTTTVTCPSSVTYDGQAQIPCSASVTGAGGLTATLTPTYVDNTAAGTATASASFGGDANHDGSSASASFEISKATSSVTVTCGAGPFTYTGDPQTPCTARGTGADGLDVDVPVTYEDNTDAGTATASATYAGDANHTGGTDTETFVIGQVDAVCTVTDYSGTYDGDPHHVSGTCTGLGDVDLTGGFEPGESFTNAGEHTTTWLFHGGTNYADQSGAASVTIGKASSTTIVSCPEGATFDGSPHQPCTATVTGAGDLDEAVAVTYADNTNAGTATASARYAGDANHNGSSDSETFTIAKATSTTVVTCPAGPFVYTGSPLTPACTASTTGADGLSVSPTVTFTNNTNAGTATASASYAGDTNHTGSNGSKTFTIDKAPSTVTLICDSPVTYTGSALQPCSAKASGAGGLDQELVVSFGDNTNAGAASASASYGGDANHESSSANTTFAIAKAGSVTTVTCPPSVTFDGSPQKPCSATVTGAGDLDGQLVVDYSDNTNAGTAHASAAYSGDANHKGSSANTTFAIAKAGSVTTVTCPPSVTFDGSPQKPCSATVTGAGDLDGQLVVDYSDNTNAGTAHASAAYSGDANHKGSSDATTFTIDKATSTVTLICTGPVTYTGSALEPCSAKVTGAGDLDEELVVTYGDNTNAGTATASASYVGDANHESSSANTTFTIAKAGSVTTVTCPVSVNWTGSAITPCTAQATGAGMNPISLSVAYQDNTDAGIAKASASWAGDLDHQGSSASVTFKIASWWTLKGFYAPVDMNGVVNVVKGGSTVPLKFEVFAGATELTTTSAVKGFAVQGVPCPGANVAVDDIELTTTGGTTLRYDTTGGQFIQNWQTPKTAGACYRVTMTTQDGSSLSALFKLK